MAGGVEPVGGDLLVLRDALPIGNLVGFQRGRSEDLFTAAVVDHFELEPGRAPNRVFDLTEALFIASRHFDDDVLVARRDGGFAQPELVDATRNRILRLGHGAIANLRLDVGADFESGLVVARAG
jgi:hypothetical protein